MCAAGDEGDHKGIFDDVALSVEDGISIKDFYFLIQFLYF